MAVFGLDDLSRISRQQIMAAGPRYSPNVDANAPNLEISILLDSIEALASSSDYRRKLDGLQNSIAESEAETGTWASRLFRKRRNTPTVCVELLARLSQEKPGQGSNTLRRVRYAARSVSKIISTRRRKLLDAHRSGDSGSRRANVIDAEFYSLRGLEDSITNLLEFIDSPAFSLIANNRLLIRGSWGTGKTHFLCDIAKQRMERQLPTLFLLGHRVQAEVNPLDSICAATGLANRPKELLARLSKLGRAAGGRALLVIDGINEGDKRGWFRYGTSVVRLLRRHPNVGLIVSCRSPFESQVLSENARKSFVEVTHRGFEGIEFDAQREYFRFYGIPAPHIPLLAPEFSRPLFLKILCQTFSGQTASAKSHWIRDLMAGQKTMTKLFEDFVSQIGAPIERDFNLKGKTCWSILKGKKLPGKGSVVGIAPTMASTLQDYVSPSDCIAAISAITGQPDEEATKIFYRLIAEGLLVEDVLYEQNGSLSIVRLPYQRFSDHLVCRHLLENYLRTETRQAIRNSLRSNQPLGRVFAQGFFINTYAMPGWATALMLEFPERTKRALSDDERELYFHLPKENRQTAPLIEPFLEGLTWRHADSFTKSTDRIVGFLVQHEHQFIREQLFETLVGLASRTGHPYSADRLARNLSTLTLVQRDLSWSEFLRKTPRESVVRRVTEWAIGHGSDELPRHAARDLIILCSTFLTTSHKGLRDRVTRALVALGQRHPTVLFELTGQALGHNDPYIPERMLAASYGVLMRCWAHADTNLVKASRSIACTLYDEMFGVNAEHSTTHILMQDYATGIIELARLMEPKALGSRRIMFIRQPFPAVRSNIPDAASIEEEQCRDADQALGMDFRNYTIGRLVPGRSNYDFEHEGYKKVLRQIEWRMLDLGYRAKLFDEVDRLISSANSHTGRSDNGSKVDRYAKKYAWISYFEVAGVRAAAGQLKLDQPRVSDCDIDPSFPQPPKSWQLHLPSQFTSELRSPAIWAKDGPDPSYRNLLIRTDVDGKPGPWALLDGYIQEAAVRDARQIFTFLRAIFVRHADVRKLRRESRKDHNPHLDVGGDYYTFYGEVPWSPKHGAYLRDKRGRARQQLTELFAKTEPYSVRKKVTSVQDLPDANLNKLVEMIIATKSSASTRAALKLTIPSQVQTTKYRHIPGIHVELPTFHFGWESYHSTENQGPNPEFVAPAISQAFQLRGFDGGSDLLDAAGHEATIFRRLSKPDGSLSGHLLYLRQDLLEEYLRRTGSVIAWINSGERTFHYSYLERHQSELSGNWHLHERRHLHFWPRKQRNRDKVY